MNARYAELNDQRQRAGHRNKCVVIAIALLTGVSYLEAHREIEGNVNRRVGPRGGYFPYEYIPVLTRMLREQGKGLHTMDLTDVRKVAKTTRTLDGKGASRLGIKFGLVHSRGHVCAVMNYRVADWSEDRVKRITRVLRVGDGVTC